MVGEVNVGVLEKGLELLNANGDRFEIINISISIHNQLLFADDKALVADSEEKLCRLRTTPTKLLKHFISKTFTFLLSAPLIPYASAPFNAVGTITPSYRHFLAFIPNTLLLRTLF